MDTHGIKNETKQDQNSESEPTHKPKSVNKDSDIDTLRSKNETKQDQNSVGPTADRQNSLNQQLKFHFTELQEGSTNSDAEQFNMNDLDIEGYHSLIRQIVKLKQPEATPFTPVEPEFCL